MKHLFGSLLLFASVAGAQTTKPTNTFTARAEEHIRTAKLGKADAKNDREQAAVIDKKIAKYAEDNPGVEWEYIEAMYAGRAIPGMRFEQLALYCWETEMIYEREGGISRRRCSPMDWGGSLHIYYLVDFRRDVVIAVERPNGDMDAAKSEKESKPAKPPNQRRRY